MDVLLLWTKADEGSLNQKPRKQKRRKGSSFAKAPPSGKEPLAVQDIHPSKRGAPRFG
jgi:hypothetical protein